MRRYWVDCTWVWCHWEFSKHRHFQLLNLRFNCLLYLYIYFLKERPLYSGVMVVFIIDMWSWIINLIIINYLTINYLGFSIWRVTCQMCQHSTLLLYAKKESLIHTGKSKSVRSRVYCVLSGTWSVLLSFHQCLCMRICVYVKTIRFLNQKVKILNTF